MSTINYTDLITRKLAGELSADEEKTLASWIAADPEHREIYRQYEKLWQEAAGYDVDYRPDLTAGLERFQAAMEKKPAKVVSIHRFNMAYKIAAIIIVLVGAFYTYTFLDPSYDGVEVATLAGETKMILLPDSTEVWLNQKSTIRYDWDVAARRVILAGEAFFDVRKVAGKKFQIEAAGSLTTVWGTSFNVKARDGSDLVEVTVVSGKVSLAHKDQAGLQQFLLPGDKGTLDRTSRTVSKTRNRNRNFLFWKNHKLIFDNDKLTAIIEELERLFDVEIQLKDPELGNCRFIGTIESVAVDEVLEILGTHMNIKSVRNGRQYVFEGEGCTGS